MPKYTPPRGYSRFDFPLHHHFFHNHTYDITLETKNDTIMTLLRASDDEIKPSTTKVNPNHASFDAKETGCQINQASIVDKIKIHTIHTLTELATETDKIHSLMLHKGFIGGCFADDWDPLDDSSSLEVEDIVRVTFDLTNRDVTPKFSGTDLVNGVQPQNTVINAEVFGDMNLTTDTKMEAVNFDPDVYFDSKRHYDNGGAVNKVLPRLSSIYLNDKRSTSISSSFTKFVPERCRYGRRGLFFGILEHVPIFSNERQICDPFTAPTAGAHIVSTTIVDFMEWNHAFDQEES